MFFNSVNGKCQLIVEGDSSKNTMLDGVESVFLPFKWEIVK